MALDPELLLLRDDGEEEFGTCGAGGSVGTAVALSCRDGSPSGRAVPAPFSRGAFCSRGQAGGFRGQVGCLQPVRDGVLFPSGHGETRVCPPHTHIDAQQGLRRRGGRQLVMTSCICGLAKDKVWFSAQGTALP